MNLSGSRVLLTGATGGIGLAIARALAARGAQLVLTGRRTDVLEPLATEVGGRAVAADLADPAAVDPLLEKAGEIDVLVANAALPGSGPVLEYSVEEIDRALNVNLRAPMLLARALGTRMVERGKGQLVFVSSLSGKTASPGAGIYCATKFGMRGFALSLREDLIDTGVGVSIVYPGFIRDAGMFAEAGAKLPFYVGTKSPDQVAAAVVEAVEKNRAEISVAPLGLRAGANLGSLLPAKVGAVQRRLGGQDLADSMARGQASKR